MSLLLFFKIDGNLAVCWPSNLDFTVERSTKTLLGSAVSGEGLVNVYRGTGKVVLPIYPNKIEGTYYAVSLEKGRRIVTDISAIVGIIAVQLLPMGREAYGVSILYLMIVAKRILIYKMR